jgi:hypothetical protein
MLLRPTGEAVRYFQNDTGKSEYLPKYLGIFCYSIVQSNVLERSMQSIDLALKHRISILHHVFSHQIAYDVGTIHHYTRSETILTVRLIYGETNSNEFYYPLRVCAADGSTVDRYWDGIEMMTSFRLRAVQSRRLSQF